MIYIVIGIVLIGAIAVVVVSLSRNENAEEADPLQARLAEFIQRGDDVTSLEDIELSQPFSERVIVPIIRKVAEFSVRFTPQKAIQNVTRMMELAGNPWPIDAATFFALRFVLALVFGGLGIAYILISKSPDHSKDLLYIGGAAFAGSAFATCSAFAGGAGATSYYGFGDVYDPGKGSWTKTPAMTTVGAG